LQLVYVSASGRQYNYTEHVASAIYVLWLHEFESEDVTKQKAGGATTIKTRNQKNYFHITKEDGKRCAKI
jgi:hypothetical protein